MNNGRSDRDLFAGMRCQILEKVNLCYHKSAYSFRGLSSRARDIVDSYEGPLQCGHGSQGTPPFLVQAGTGISVV